MLHKEINKRTNKRQPVIRDVPRRNLVNAQAPASRANTPLTWRVRQYVENSGASYEPLLADMTTDSDVDYHIQSFKGYVADNDQAQYTHKFYSCRIIADQDVSIPIQIYWAKNLAIITEIGGVETTVYTTGTDDNVAERLLVDLSLGVNDLHILTYTGVGDPRLEIVMDLTSIHSSVTLIDPISGDGGVFRIVDTTNLFGPDSAGASFVSGDNNFFGGYRAGEDFSSGDSNTFLGGLAASNALEGDENIAIGPLSLDSLDGGLHNVAIGTQAGHDITDGHGNLLIGQKAGQNITDADFNIVIGEGAFVNETTGGGNIAIGSTALATTDGAFFNVAIGDSALESGTPVLTGLGNVCLGAWAGANIEGDSDKNVCLGYFAGPPADSVIDELLYIDNHATASPLIEGDFAGHTVHINGTLSKDAGAFKITHPLDDTKYLYHGFVESPKYGLRYDGDVELENGIAVVNIDSLCGMRSGTFDALNQDVRVFLQNMSGFASVRPSTVVNGEFSIVCEDVSSDDFISWMVCGERKDDFVIETDGTDDAGHLILEVDKPARKLDDEVISHDEAVERDRVERDTMWKEKRERKEAIQPKRIALLEGQNNGTSC